MCKKNRRTEEREIMNKCKKTLRWMERLCRVARQPRSPRDMAWADHLLQATGVSESHCTYTLMHVSAPPLWFLSFLHSSIQHLFSLCSSVSFLQRVLTFNALSWGSLKEMRQSGECAGAQVEVEIRNTGGLLKMLKNIKGRCWVRRGGSCVKLSDVCNEGLC